MCAFLVLHVIEMRKALRCFDRCSSTLTMVFRPLLEGPPTSILIPSSARGLLPFPHFAWTFFVTIAMQWTNSYVPSSTNHHFADGSLTATAPLFAPLARKYNKTIIIITETSMIHIIILTFSDGRLRQEWRAIIDGGSCFAFSPTRTHGYWRGEL